MSNSMVFPKRRTLKKWVRFSLLGIIIVFFLFSIHIISTCFIKEETNQENMLYSYTIKQDADYNVGLYDNSYIDSEYLGKDETYIADLIKEINIDYKYNYSGSKIVPLTYTYNVSAIINGEYTLEQEESKVWTKEYNLVETVTKKVNNNNITIQEPIKIDFRYYDDIVSQFRKELKIPITASLKVLFSINIKSDVNGEVVEDDKVMTLDIPLNQQAFKITENYEDEYSNTIMPKIEESDDFSYRRLVVGCLLLVTSIFIFILFFREIFNIPKKNQYTIKLSRILREYGDVIVEVINPISEEEMNVVEVKNFNEMVDLEEELRIPILFYESIEYLEGEFTIAHDNILYKFVLKNE